MTIEEALDKLKASDKRIFREEVRPVRQVGCAPDN